MSDYKENVEEFETKEETQETENVAPESVEPSDSSELNDDIETAFLVIKKKNGMVLPISDLDNLKIERKATAHDVFRMCADVQDQVSSIRVVGELAQIFQHLTEENLKVVAKLLSKKMNENLQG